MNHGRNRVLFSPVALWSLALFFCIALGSQAVAVDWDKCHEAEGKEAIDALNMEMVCYHSSLPGTGRHSDACKEDDKRVCQDLSKMRQTCNYTGKFINVEFEKHYCEAGCGSTQWKDNVTKCCGIKPC